jgi:hypothetical protein
MLDPINGELPLVLAGPVPRRCSRDTILIWLCTSKSMTLNGYVYGISKGKFEVSAVIGTTRKTEQIQLGQYLFFHMVEIVPLRERFPAETPLAYDIVSGPLGTTPSQDRAGLASLLNVNDIALLPLSPYQLPTIVLQSEAELRFVYGSCRKLHGAGSDRLIFERVLIPYISRIDSVERPHALFLIGDQIYADDVSDGLAAHMSLLGSRLCGAFEHLPGGHQYPVGWDRSFCLGERTGFSAEKSVAKNHAFRFGEYVSLYLLTWNKELWPVKYGFDEPSPTSDAFRSQIEKVNLNTKRLDEAKASAGDLRRLLANTPTYMIFDDHEVTDDWNFDETWKAGVHGKPGAADVQSRLGKSLGQAIVINALTAYWAFQGWGNVALGTFTQEDFIRPLESYFLTDHRERQPPPFDERAIIWSFDTATTPPVFFLDTRTRRESDTRHFRLTSDKRLAELPPQNNLPYIVDVLTPSGDRLLERAALDELKNSLQGTGSIVLLVSATPIFPHNRIEAAGDGWSSFLRTKRGAQLRGDREGWSRNPWACFELYKALFEVNTKSVVIFSGDVHYAFAKQAELFDMSPFGRQRRIRLAQFVSSPMKNTSSALGLFNERPDRDQHTAFGQVLDELQILQRLNREPDAIEVQERRFSPVLETHVKMIDCGFPGGRALAYQTNFGQVRVRGTNLQHRYLVVDQTCVTRWIDFDQLDW